MKIFRAKSAFAVILPLILLISLQLPTLAAGIYVDGGVNTLPGSLSDAYAVGGDGSVGKVSGSYALTARGTEYVDGPNNGGVPNESLTPAPISGTIQIASNTIKVGLKYYYSASRDSSVDTAALNNVSGGGFKFGYYDGQRNFIETGSTAENEVTVTCYSGGNTAVITKTGTSQSLFSFSKTNNENFAILAQSSSGKAVTSFSGVTYYGGFEFNGLSNNKITVINVVDIEDYTVGVLGSEMSYSWPIEALKAQAVAAKTYAARMIKNSSYYNAGGYDLTNDTYTQAYSGTSRLGNNNRIADAVSQTSGQYIAYDNRLIDALYFSSDGGSTEDNVNINGTSIPYLKGVIDPYEAAIASENIYSTWTVIFTPAALGSRLGMGSIASVVPTYSPTNNCIKLVVTDVNGNTRTIERYACCTALGLRSIHYTVTKNAEGSYVFDGGGWGHSVGMSQFGAKAMAQEYDFNYRQIIGFYYTGVNLATAIYAA